MKLIVFFPVRNHCDTFGILVVTVTEPEIGQTVALLQAALPELGPAQRAVAAVIVSNPSTVLGLSASELGQMVGTTAATVTRVCQAIHLTGYPHLCRLLARDAGAEASTVRDERAAEGSLRRLFEQSGRELTHAPVTVDLQVYRAAVEALIAARKIVIVGSGSSSPTVSAATLNFLSSGVSVTLVSEAVLQLLACRLLVEGDVLLAVSDSGENQATLSAARAAYESGATVLAVTAFGSSSLATVSSHTLVIGSAAQPWPNSVMTSTILQNVLLNAVVRDVAAVRGDHSAAASVTEAVLRQIAGNRRPGVGNQVSPDVNL